MHLRGQTSTFQTRLEISEQAAAGLNDTQIAERNSAGSPGRTSYHFETEKSTVFSIYRYLNISGESSVGKQSLPPLTLDVVSYEWSAPKSHGRWSALWPPAPPSRSPDSVPTFCPRFSSFA